MADIPETVSIKSSRLKLAGLGLLAIVMTGVSAALAFGGAFDFGSVASIAGYAGTFLFGGATVYTVIRIFGAQLPVITVSPDGISDARLAKATIKWPDIQNVTVWEMHEQQVIVLQVAPETEASIGLTRAARWSRKANKMLGADGLCITASGLLTTHDELLALILKYHASAVGEAAAAKLLDDPANVPQAGFVQTLIGIERNGAKDTED